jgi:hypothetical protein
MMLAIGFSVTHPGRSPLRSDASSRGTNIIIRFSKFRDLNAILALGNLTDGFHR